MKYITTSIVLTALVAGVSCSSTTSENIRIQQLNRKLEAQQRQIDQLKVGLSSSSEEHPAVKGFNESQVISPKQQVAGWMDPRNWEKIQRGMSQQQVISILGSPTRREDIIGPTLFWEGHVPGSGDVSGNVRFYNNQASSIAPPVFLNK